MLSILADRTYRRLFAAQVLSLVGSGLATVALALLAYDLAGEDAGQVLGAALALKMIAYVGVAPIVGAFAARAPRRGFLIALDLCRAGLVLLLPFVDSIWQVFALVFLFQAFSAAFTPTFQATIPDVLPDERQYSRALSLSRLAYDLEALLSPTLAGLLLVLISFEWLFVGTAIGFLASAALVFSTVLPPARKGDAAESFRSRLIRGAWIYLATPRLRGLLALNVAVSAAGAMVIVNTVVLVRGPLGGDDGDVALFLAASGLGSMLVALVLPRLLETVSPRGPMLLGAGGLVAALLLASLGPGFEAGLALWFAFGAAASLVQTPGGLLLRRSSHAADRPALYAAHFSLSHACWLAAYPAAGWLGAAFGLSTAFLCMAAAAVLGAVAAARLWPADDPEELVHEHPELEHAHPHSHDAHHSHAHAASASEAERHSHSHRHPPLRHSHAFVIDDHHPFWPSSQNG